MPLRFTPNLEVLGERLNPSTATPAVLAGDQCLVFVLGGVASSDARPNLWVTGTELPDADGVVLLASSLPGRDAEHGRRNLVTTLSADVDPPAVPDGRHLKMLFAALVLELDAPPAAGTHLLYQDIFIPATSDPFGFARDGRASGL